MRYLPLVLAASLSFSASHSFADSNFAAIAAAASPPPTASSTTSSVTFSAGDRSAIEDIIKDYLVNKHPEVIKQAYDELQKRDQNDADTKSKQALVTSKDKIYNDPNTPVGGNPHGDVAVVEFFDFQCGYCKLVEEATEKLIKEDKNIKFIYKDFPILGAVSVTASKAALASIKQNKYVAFHDALMSKKEHITEDAIFETAKSVGINVEKLKKDMADSDITKQIQTNLQLASDLGVRGTPLFIIGSEVFPGAMQYDQMTKAVQDARTADKK